MADLDPAPETAPAPAPAPSTAPGSTPAPPPVTDPPASGTEPIQVQNDPATGAIITVPTSAMRRIKEEERARGKRLAKQEADQRAQSLGFANTEELEQAAAATKKPAVVAPTAPAPEPALPASGDDVAQLKAAIAQLEAKNRQLAKKNVGADRETRRLQQELEAAEAASALKFAAAKAGVVDVDYALHVLKKHVATLPSDGSAVFDEGKFFRETLRASHPALYAVQDRPATTGHSEPAVSRPTPVVKPPETNGAGKDALKLSREEYDARLRALGLTNPASGVPG